jgi:DNA-directed RNA polymerase specialized sigma24 family protein
MIYSDSDRGFDEILDSLQPLHKSDSSALQELFREGSDVMRVRFAGLIAEHRALDEHEIHSVRDAVRRLVKRWRPYPFSTAGKKALDRMPRSIKANIFRRLPDELLDELTQKSDDSTTSALQSREWRGDEPREWRFGRAWKKLADGRPAMRRFVDLPLSQAVRALRSLLIRVNERAILDAARVSLPLEPSSELLHYAEADVPQDEIETNGEPELQGFLDLATRAGLSRRDRELMLRLYTNRMDHREAAHSLGISWGAERVAHFRAKAKLRHMKDKICSAP